MSFVDFRTAKNDYFNGNKYNYSETPQICIRILQYPGFTNTNQGLLRRYAQIRQIKAMPE
ncbi:MAG TPA: hypothetical protein DCF44_07600 [Chitinophagaceae bacterium]|nr:hypothetical protein [Chitinophagaceae bacterium]